MKATTENMLKSGDRVRTRYPLHESYTGRTAPVREAGAKGTVIDFPESYGPKSIRVQMDTGQVEIGDWTSYERVD